MQAIKVVDSANIVYAEVSRHVNEAEGLDYVAIWHNENLICISIEDVPNFLRAVMVAANRKVA